MAHFVDEYLHSHAEPKPKSRRGRVDANEYRKAKQRLEIESAPLRLGFNTAVGNCVVSDCSSFQLADMATDPFRLCRLRGQQWQACQPAFACLLEFAMRFQRPGMGGQLLHLVA